MQLFFLLSNDLTGYKLAANVYDLTTAQIEFYRICAEKIQSAIDDARSGGTKTNSALGIDTKHDSPEVIREKLEIFKQGVRKNGNQS